MATVVYQSEWVKITHRDDTPESTSVYVEFPRTNYPGFRCSPGDAHELGQALFHAGRQILEEKVGHSVRPMPGFAAPE